MEEDATRYILDYYTLCGDVGDIIRTEQQRRELQSTATTLKHILTMIQSSEDSNKALEKYKNELERQFECFANHKLDQEAKITTLSIQLENLKASKHNNEGLLKEIHTLKMQVNKLNKQILESNLEKERMKETSKRTRILLETKLEAARRKVSMAELYNDTLSTTTKKANPASKESPFNEDGPIKGSLSMSTPITKPATNEAAISTPIPSATPSKAGPVSTTKKTNSVKKLFQMSKLAGAKPKRSLFDMNDDDDDDFFNRSISKVAKEHATKKKLVKKVTVENEDLENKSPESPAVQRVKANDIARVGSPLKPRSEHQKAFKFNVK